MVCNSTCNMVCNSTCNMMGNDSLQDSQNTGDNPWKAAHKKSERVEQQQMDC